MPKTVAISDDVHILITEKQLELFRKYRVSAKIADLTEAAIKYGINNVDKVFVHGDMISKLKIVEEKDVLHDKITVA